MLAPACHCGQAGRAVKPWTPQLEERHIGGRGAECIPTCAPRCVHARLWRCAERAALGPGLPVRDHWFYVNACIPTQQLIGGVARHTYLCDTNVMCAACQVMAGGLPLCNVEARAHTLCAERVVRCSPVPCQCGLWAGDCGGWARCACCSIYCTRSLVHCIITDC